MSMQYAKKAELFARRMHKGQVDKGGNPYILHPQAVADGVSGDKNKAVAWLHDVLEDCDEYCDEDVLKSEGFPDDIIQAVKLLTHKRWVPYQDYIHELSSNPMAKSVKISDLRNNMDISRMHGIDDGRISKRMEKYRKAYDYLMKEEQQ